MGDNRKVANFRKGLAHGRDNRDLAPKKQRFPAFIPGQNDGKTGFMGLVRGGYLW
ncbi:hypothetical protein MICA_702 [Micavibrio aeruginosavorus ARL-13]|uniref:Uncharacterized protein n=1 Tax=Micavibrio aeruginosavorus (strain ARL-13) TaxID=856793 RepID=G2KPD5_MICAA|nr:hypothetical protein MICA_702 [Micavibrio aeruginosavorus ARL-13]